MSVRRNAVDHWRSSSARAIETGFLKRAGLKERSFHSLRHRFISELVRRGAGLEAVRTLAGHSKLDMTQRYAHATADDLRAAIDMLGK